jgi:ATP-dependent Clp protease ATP-binding subunit ClpX
MSRALIFTPSSKTLHTRPIPLIRRTICTTPSLSADSQFYRSDFSSQGYVGSYDPNEAPKGPLSQLSRHGATRLTPKALKEHLDKFVVGQDKAKKVTSVAIFNHYQRIREIRRQEYEDEEKRKKILRWESREKAERSHPVESIYPYTLTHVSFNNFVHLRYEMHSLTCHR